MRQDGAADATLAGVSERFVLRRWDEHGKAPDLVVALFAGYPSLPHGLAGVSESRGENQQGGGG